MSKVEVNSPTRGIVGYLHELEYDKDSILVFQIPRKTDMINDDYRNSAMNALSEILPQGKKAIMIGSDVNIYELTGVDAVVLKLKGIV